MTDLFIFLSSLILGDYVDLIDEANILFVLYAEVFKFLDLSFYLA